MASIMAGGALMALLISEHTPLFGFMEYGYRFAIVFAISSEAVALVALTILLVLNRETRRKRRPRHRRSLAVVPPGRWR
ncbi:MAG: hypothetical protein JOZ64_07665 [Solirubrobacterales bacterium]|nr:hypothetical protein [Solirubrobacterales bacterium]